MNQKKIHAQILEHAKTLVTLHDKVAETHKNKNANPTAWQTACDNLLSQYNRLAFPGGLQEGLSALKIHEPSAIMLAIEFLKADPYYHRSGYNKQKIAHLLKTAPLTKEQIKDLQEFLLKSIKSKQFFCLEYARLARQIQDAQFKAQIEAIIKQSSNNCDIENAQKMLLTMNS
jgi:hypothetical protein